MLIEQILYGLKDITILPTDVSDVNSRKEVNTYYDLNGKKVLPIFASPMAAVVNMDNLKCFWENNIIPIIPRTFSIESRLDKVKAGEWIAVGLKEFADYFSRDNDFITRLSNIKKHFTLHVLIDVANGHMQQIIDLVESARLLEKRYGNIKLVIMVGNIANAEYIEYVLYHNIDIDYIRMGIGGGACCITSAQTKVHCPLASLIAAAYTIISKWKKDHPMEKCPKLVADGGIRTYADIITALALGADYVMIGTTLSSLYESASDFYCYYDRNNCFEPIKSINNSADKYKLKDDSAKLNYISLGGVYKRNFGMSTPEAQQAIDKDKESRLTEGLVRYIPCVKTFKMWHDELDGYMKSCMSYLGIFDIKDIQRAKCYIMSPNASASINKPADNSLNNQDFFITE